MVKTGIPTYAELVQCVQEKQHMYQGQAPEQDKDEHILPHDAAIKQQMVKTEISTQAKLAKCIEEEQCVEEEEQGTGEILEDKHFPSLDAPMKQQMKEEIDDHQSVSMETLLDLLKKTEEDKNKLPQENQHLVGKNEQLTIQIEQLQLTINTTQVLHADFDKL